MNLCSGRHFTADTAAGTATVVETDGYQLFQMGALRPQPTSALICAVCTRVCLTVCGWSELHNEGVMRLYSRENTPILNAHTQKPERMPVNVGLPVIPLSIFPGLLCLFSKHVLFLPFMMKYNMLLELTGFTRTKHNPNIYRKMLGYVHRQLGVESNRWYSVVK